MADNMFWESLGNTVVYWLTGLVRLYFICALLIACSVKQPFFKKQQCKGVF